MPVIRATQVINRPVDVVFDTVADASSFHRWNPTITHARKVSEGEPRLGSTFEWQLRGFGTVVQELGEFERNRRIRIVPHIRGLRGGHRFAFTDQGASTRIDHELEMRPSGWFRLLTPLLGVIGRRNLRDTMRALKPAPRGKLRLRNVP
jgi:hypothetical protein